MRVNRRTYEPCVPTFLLSLLKVGKKGLWEDYGEIETGNCVGLSGGCRWGGGVMWCFFCGLWVFCVKNFVKSFVIWNKIRNFALAIVGVFLWLFSDEIGPIAQLVSSTWLIIRGSLVQAQVGPQRWMSLCWHPSFFCVYWQNNCCISVFFIEKHAFFVFWLSFCVNFSIKNI